MDIRSWLQEVQHEDTVRWVTAARSPAVDGTISRLIVTIEDNTQLEVEFKLRFGEGTERFDLAALEESWVESNPFISRHSPN
jgi:hypothetical protein